MFQFGGEHGQDGGDRSVSACLCLRVCVCVSACIRPLFTYLFVYVTGVGSLLSVYLYNNRWLILCDRDNQSLTEISVK